ncbi:MAG: FmdE family protein [Candidatus Promineifilaceae bacterium]
MSHSGVPDTDVLGLLLQESGALHHHLCPRQVLGVRLGLYGLRLLGFIDDSYQPRFTNPDKRLLTIIEIDGCGADGIAVSTGCWVGKRTLRVVDIGKVAATLVDAETGRAIRVTPSHDSRSLACDLAPEAESRWHAYLQAYQFIPDDLLMNFREVRLVQSIENILSTPEAYALCDLCGEEIFNAREVEQKNLHLCRTCAGNAYYQIDN